MKKLLFILIVVCLGCHDEPKSDGKGCMTGIHKTTMQREFIRCCTKAEYLAGDNVSAGGSTHVDAYTSWEWTPTTDCSKCQ